MKKLFKSPVIILAIALVLIAASGIGATRAAIVYQSAAESVNFETAQLSVALQEGAEGTDYATVEDRVADNATSYGLTFPGIDRDNFKIGNTYSENVQVYNSGTYDEYVRLIVTKSWYKDGVKDTTLDPSLISLGKVADFSNDWIEVAGSSPEQTIYYLNKPLSPGYGAQLFNTITVSDTVMQYVTTTEKKSDTYTTITNEYKYNGQSFFIEIEVDAVQTHNTVEAIKGAWGIDVTSTDVDGGTITLK